MTKELLHHDPATLFQEERGMIREISSQCLHSVGYSISSASGLARSSTRGPRFGNPDFIAYHARGSNLRYGPGGHVDRCAALRRRTLGRFAQHIRLHRFADGWPDDY